MFIYTEGSVQSVSTQNLWEIYCFKESLLVVLPENSLVKAMVCKFESDMLLMAF